MMDRYKAKMEEVRVQRFNTEHQVKVLRDLAVDIHELRRKWPYLESSVYNDSTSFRLKMLRPLFDEDKKDEDNPYSMAAVYRYNLSKEKDDTKTGTNERKAVHNRFDEEIERKHKMIQEGQRLGVNEERLQKTRAETEDYLHRLINNYKIEDKFERRYQIANVPAQNYHIQKHHHRHKPGTPSSSNLSLD